MSLFTQDLTHCLPASRPLGEAYAHRVASTRAALEWVADAADPSLAALKASLEADDLGPAAELARHLTNNTSDLVVLGVGGSSLGAQTLAQLKFWGTQAAFTPPGAPRLRFPDNLDGATFAELLKTCDLRTTRFLCVSKSGTTAETLMQTMAAIDAIESAGGGKYLKFHFAGIAEPGGNPLRRMLEQIGAPIVEHDKYLGGRFSVFSPVGAVPALALGLDMQAIRAGARQTLTTALDTRRGHDVPDAAQGAAVNVAARDIGLMQTVLWPYCDRLERFAAWWRQLWAESLGKQGQGTTPIAGIGPVDQHSQLQLYLEGPPDKLFTLIEAPHETRRAQTAAKWAQEPGLELYAGRTLNDLAAAELRATAETLAKYGRPVRVLRLLAELDERMLGSLLMHFMLETLIAAKLWNVDPFGQPAVEEGKRLARDYLKATGP